jgi:cyanophycinase-like exopeptidase
MSPDDVREAVQRAVIEALVSGDLVRACTTVQFAFVGADEVRVSGVWKGGELVVQAEVFREGVALGGFSA